MTIVYIQLSRQKTVILSLCVWFLKQYTCNVLRAFLNCFKTKRCTGIYVSGQNYEHSDFIINRSNEKYHFKNCR